MTSKELERLVAALTHFGRAHLDQLTRALRAAGLLPASGRGRAAMPLAPIDVARYLIALGAAEQPSRSPAACELYAGLKHRGGSQNWPTLLVGMTTLLAERDLAVQLASLVICRSTPLAIISLTDGDEVRYGTDDDTHPGATSAAPVFCAIRPTLILAAQQALSAPSGAARSRPGIPTLLPERPPAAGC
jgi:hypothetical protein